MNCEYISKENVQSRSFKVTVAADKRDMLLDAKLWPEDIIVRKIFKPRNHGPRSN